MSRQALALALLIFGLVARPVAAQGPFLTQPLDSGTIVRLGWRAGSPQIVKLLAPLRVGSDTVAYCRYQSANCAAGAASEPEPEPEIGLARELWSVEVQRGARTGRGALLGGATGLGILVLGSLVYQEESPVPLTAVRIAGAATFVAITAGIGALIGRGAAHWEPAP